VLVLLPVAEKPVISIESGIASRASTHKGKIRKSSTAARYPLSANFRCEQMSEIGWFEVCSL
jgi:hypothetical protein